MKRKNVGETSEIARIYESSLRSMVALVPLLAIVYLTLYQDPDLLVLQHGLHQFTVVVAVLVAGFLSSVMWRCYTASRRPFLSSLTLAFLGFAIVYAPHGIFCLAEQHDEMLCALFGPAARMTMAAFLFGGLLQCGRPRESLSCLSREGFWWRATGMFLVLDLALVGATSLPPSVTAFLRMSFEAGALLLTVAAIFVIARRRPDSSVLVTFTIALAIFAQSSLAYLIGDAWNHQWWLAHLIFSAGLLLLSYAGIRLLRDKGAFYRSYSQDGMIRRLRTANLELSRRAATDSLTGASSRGHFFERMSTEWARARREGTDLSLLLVDLDHFKHINDEWGHQAGDEVLKAFVAEARSTLRDADVIGRVGGEEFAILLPKDDGVEASRVAERLRARVDSMAPRNAGDQRAHVTICVGPQHRISFP